MNPKEVRYTAFDSPVGRIGLAFTSRGLCRVLLRLECHGEISDRFSREIEGPVIRDDEVGRDLVDNLGRYLGGERWEYQGELDLEQGTPFQKRVWQEVKAIPYGEVRNYGWIAERVGCPRGQRAVGQANAVNPIPLIIPCHRVIRSDGNLGGYSCGLSLKKELLALEGGLKHVAAK